MCAMNVVVVAKKPPRMIGSRDEKLSSGWNFADSCASSQSVSTLGHPGFFTLYQYCLPLSTDEVDS
jgi:hypothetical protein